MIKLHATERSVIDGRLKDDAPLVENEERRRHSRQDSQTDANTDKDIAAIYKIIKNT